MFDRKAFESQLPSFIAPLLDELISHGFITTIVGGCIRDFLRVGVLGHDWDVELTHETLAFNKNQWKDLGKTLSKFGKMTFLPYEIIRVEADSYQLEFSPPRIERYRENATDHSNFDADFDFKLPFKEAIKRRDFTINAMGVRFKNRKEIEFLDPLDGLKNLREKILHPAGPDFAKDPVRFLRAVRFALKYQLHYSPELKKILDSMHVGSFTHSYLWSEMQKSNDPITYLELMIKEKAQHPDLKLPVETDIHEVRKFLTQPSKHEAWMIALEWVNISSDNWCRYFNLGSESSRRLARWAEFTKHFQKLLPETFHGEFEKIRDTENFNKLFDWYFTTKQLLQKNPELPLLKMIEEFLPDWIHLYKFEAVKDVKHIDPPFRAKYQVWNLCQRL